MRTALDVGVAGAVTAMLGLLACASPASAQSATGAATHAAGARSPARAHAGRGRSKRQRRPGCRTFCRQAGGFGAGGGPVPKPKVLIPSQRVRVTARRTVVLRMRCIRRAGCNGAVLLNGPAAVGDFGRSDLRLRFGPARRVEVDVSQAGIAYLRRHGRVRQVYAVAVLVGVADPSASKPLTLLAPRRGRAAASARARPHRRPGCGRFCRQAGGLGAGPGVRTPPPDVIIPSQTARLTGSRTVLLRMRCVRRGGCRGAVLLNGPAAVADFGRSDLRLRRGRTVRVEVAVTAAGAAYVRRVKRVRQVFASVVLVQGSALSTSKPLTILAPRHRR